MENIFWDLNLFGNLYFWVVSTLWLQKGLIISQDLARSVITESIIAWSQGFQNKMVEETLKVRWQPEVCFEMGIICSVWLCDKSQGVISS